MQEFKKTHLQAGIQNKRIYRREFKKCIYRREFKKKTRICCILASVASEQKKKTSFSRTKYDLQKFGFFELKIWVFFLAAISENGIIQLISPPPPVSEDFVQKGGRVINCNWSVQFVDATC